MSSSNSRSPDVQGSRRTLDEFDLTAFGRRTICAILLPESSSADYSAHLAENIAKVAQVAPYKTLPSPSNSSSEDESNASQTASGPKSSRKSSRKKKEREGSQLVIVLEQSRDDEKFKFVSSSSIKGLRSGNDVVLKHPYLGIQDNCYINLLHLELYPDPDSDVMVLYNRSTSEFTAHPLSKSEAYKIKPGCQTTLERGTWRLTLGKGLTFLIKILPRPHEEVCCGCLRLSPKGPALCVKSSKSSVAAVSIKATAKVKPPTATISQTDISKEKSSKAIHTREKAKIESALEVRPRSNSQKKTPQEPLINLGETAFSKVFKANRNGTAAAVKVCRNPDPKESADRWRNELDILKHLNHVGQRVKSTLTELNIRQLSVVRLLEHDASILSLELEYIGPDLSQSIDKHKMSQLSQDKQYRIWIDVAKGLEYIHAQRIIHRDIKPQNILLGEGGRGAVICDFGLSAEVYQDPETFNGGTPCYIPPEYLINSPRGSEGDIWAFGVTMLFVLRLIPLPQDYWKIAAVYHDLDVRRTMVDWLHGIRQAVKIVPEALSPLRTMLAEAPENRITAATLAEDPLLQPLHHTLPA